LLDGEFIPKNPGALYPVITAVSENKSICGLYNDMFLYFEEMRNNEIDIINAKASEESIIFCESAAGKYHVEVFDCMGEKLDDYTKSLIAGGNLFKVPPSGLLKLSK